MDRWVAPQFYPSYFISGLKPKICHKVQVFQPVSLTHSIGLATLQEEKLNDRPTRNTTSYSPKSSFCPTLTTTSAPQTPSPLKTSSPATPHHQKIPPLSTTSPLMSSKLAAIRGYVITVMNTFEPATGVNTSSISLSLSQSFPNQTLNHWSRCC